jgi:HAD superfamily 5'-nucleotidase-like hydrolase
MPESPDWRRDLEASLPEAGSEGALLHHALDHVRPPDERRIFVNRTLRLETIRHVGFDLDWTLADYERQPLEELTFGLAIDRLISDHDFPEAIRRVDYRPDFPRRGLMIDKSEGTVLRMNRHRYVGEAYLGRRRLEPRELIALYRQDPLNPASGRYYHVDSLFELPETNLFSELVELTQQDTGLGLPPYPRLFEEVRRAIDWVHGHGTMKSQILDELPVYLRRNRELGLALERLALGGRKLILITNSPWPYVGAVCAYLFDELLPGLDSWRQLFDLVIVESSKPAFFREERPFRRLADGGEVVEEVAVPEWGGVFAGGSLKGLMALLACPGEQVLYVGDHIYGDIVSSKLGSTWRTALIVRELEEELHKSRELSGEIERLRKVRARLAELGFQMDWMGDVTALVQRLSREHGAVAEATRAELAAALTRLRRRHRQALQETRRLAERISSAFNLYWGSFFKQGSNKTLFASQLESFACLYTSRVSNFGFYGTNHYFRVIEDPMEHETR